MSVLWKEGYGKKDTKVSKSRTVVPISRSAAKPSDILPEHLEACIVNREYKPLNKYLKGVATWFHSVYDHRRHYSNLTIHTFQVPTGTNYEELSDYCQEFFGKHGFLTMRVNNPSINLIGILVKKRS